MPWNCVLRFSFGTDLSGLRRSGMARAAEAQGRDEAVAEEAQERYGRFLQES
jgi:hypothetical protein